MAESRVGGSSLEEAQAHTTLDLRMDEAHFEAWVQRSIRRTESTSRYSQAQKAHRRCAERLRRAARTTQNLPAWTAGAADFPYSGYTLEESLTLGEQEVFAVLSPEFQGSIGELIAHVKTLVEATPQSTSSGAHQ